jgi:hypothetical protein
VARHFSGYSAETKSATFLPEEIMWKNVCNRLFFVVNFLHLVSCKISAKKLFLWVQKFKQKMHQRFNGEAKKNVKLLENEFFSLPCHVSSTPFTGAT